MPSQMEYNFPTVGNIDTKPAEILLESNVLYATIPDEPMHEALLEYLTSRLQSDQTTRAARLERQARIDKMVSTWQKLSEADSVRAAENQATGKGVAININLPLVTTHLDDMVSFYAGIYSPASGSFYQIPEVGLEDVAQGLVDKLNTDAEKSRYYSTLIKTMRALLKYNYSGLHLQFGDESLLDWSYQPEGMNHGEYLDMYNVLWDPLVSDPALVRLEAEWAAKVEVKNRMWLIRRERSGLFAGVKHALPESLSNGNHAKFYRNPPAQAGVTSGDATTGSDEIDWSGYGAALAGDAEPLIVGHEVVTMYCWLNPAQFKLDNTKKGNREQQLQANYSLWKFVIVDQKRIVHAEPVDSNPDLGLPVEIPFYMGRQMLDDLGVEQRSTAELMGPFQTYSSFLLNADIAATRGGIFGIRVYDGTAVDMSGVPTGAVVADIPTKAPGRDVRSIIQQINGQLDTNMTQKLGQIMQMLKEFFPAQAMPAQIAGIDRAVTNQVSAVMQGMVRRLHTTVHVIDNDMLGPYAHACYRNLVRAQTDGIGQIDDDLARKILSTGLAQLQRESIEAAMRQVLFAVIQNPETAQNVDVMSLFQYWASLLNSAISVKKFVKAAPPQPNPEAQTDAAGAPAVPGGQGLA